MKLLRRPGTKTKLADKIVPLFPKHNRYIELFFGAGGIFFNKPKVKYNVCNDIDDDVFNLFMVTSNEKSMKELKNFFFDFPLSSTLFNYYKKNKETDPIKKAARFLFLSNFSFLGKNDTFQIKVEGNAKKFILEALENTHKFIWDVQFISYDFRDVFSKFEERSFHKSDTFIYADPPYLGTDNMNYQSDKFTKKDTEDLFEVLVNTKVKFAISEFNNPVILDLAKFYKLEVIHIGERRTLENRNTEVLITNYPITHFLI